MSAIEVRVTGPYACFTRPEMKVERVSYDVMTPSAAVGILEAVYWKPAVNWVIERVHVLRPIAFTSVRRNEVGKKIPPRTVQRAMEGKEAMLYIAASEEREQRAGLFLRDVDYVIEAHLEPASGRWDPAERDKHYGIALRRLARGQCFHTPWLGTRECPALVELIADPAQIPPSPLRGEQDLGWMFYGYDYSRAIPEPRFFRAVLHDGIYEAPSPREVFR